MDPERPQPSVDLRTLEKVQRVVQYAATLAVLITVLLVVLTSRKLVNVNRELKDRQGQLENKIKELNEADAELKKRQDEIKTLDTRIASTSKAMRAIEPVGASAIPADPQPPTARPIPARVYVQIFEETQRARARELQSTLEAAGFVVPGIENVGSTRAPRQTESDVRFYGGATDMSDIAAIRNIANRFGVTLKEVPLKASTRVRPRHYELWLGKDFQ
jgi:hypothetical protein